MSASSQDTFPGQTRKAMLTDKICQGDWFKTKSTVRNQFGKHRPQCYEYSIPPRLGWGAPKSAIQVSHLPLPTSHYMGPVHGEPEYFGDYVTICVPSHRVANTLCWVNVRKGDITFADKVPARERLQWQSKGWENRYLASFWDDEEGP
jgi:hypothetical protein